MLKKKSPISHTWLTLLMMVVLIGTTAMAQSTFTGTGNWSTTGNWSAGVPTNAIAATIASGANCTVDVAAQCASLTFAAINANSVLTISGTNSIAITGALTMPRPAAGFTGTVNINAGTITCASIALSATTVGRNDVINITTGTLSVSGNITSAGVGCQIVFSSTGTLNAGGTFMSGTAGTFTASTSTVNFNAAAAQAIAPFAYTFNNVTLTGSNAKTTTNATINGILSMEGTATTAGTVATYGAAATLQYKGSAAQTTGTEFPATFTGTGGVIINNSNGVTLGAAKTVSNLLTMTSGTLNMANTNLTVGSLTGSGNLTHSSGAAGARTLTIGSDNTSPAVYTGVISNGTATSVAVTKNGTGTLTLSGTNTYSGTTTLTAGTLSLANTAALGAAGNALVLNGGTLDLNTDASVNAFNVTVGGSASIVSDKATAASPGIIHTLGTLSINASTLTIAGGSNVTSGTAGITFGAVTHTAAPTYTVNDPAGGGTTQLSLGAVTNSTFLTTFNGNGDVIQTGVFGNGTGGITYSGTGTLTLSQANTFTGALTVSGGTVIGTANAAALGAGALTLSGGTLRLTNASGTNLNFGRNTTVSVASTIASDVTVASTAGNIYTLGTLSINGSTLTIVGGSNVTSGTAGITFGAVTHTAAPTYTVSDPAGGGATRLSLGAVTNSTFLTTFNGNGDVIQTGVFGNGTGGITYSGTGTLTLSQANTFTGALTVSGGTVIGTANAAALGAGALTLSGGTLRLTNASGTNLNFGRNTTVSVASTIASDVTVASTAGNIYTLGTLSINGSTLTIVGGSNVTSGTAGITFGAVTHTAAPTYTVSDPAGGGATRLSLGAVTNSTFLTTFNGNGDVIQTGVFGNGTGGITYSGTGTLTLSQANTFTGAVTISAGTLKLGVGSNVAGSGPLGTNAGGVTVASGAVLDLNGFTIGATNAEALTINGTGLTASPAGALTNTGPAASYLGTITLGTASTITATTSGTLTIAAVTNGTMALALDGAGTGSVSGVIGASTGTVTKNGTGTWTLSGVNTYTGGTTLNSGTLNINNASALGTIAGTFTIAGGTIDAGGGAITTVNYPLALNGNFTFTGTNALNLGTGAVTMNNNCQASISASTLTIGGAISGASYNLIKAGAGTLNLGTNTVTLNGLAISTGTLTATSSTTNISGNFSNSGTFTANNGTLNLIGSTAQTIGGTSASTFNNLTINNANGVSLNAPVSLANTGTLTLTSGTLTTDAANLLTITNTAVGSITGASSTSYINGPLAMTLLANITADGTTYLYPVGENGNYRPLELVNIRTGATTPIVRVTLSGTGASTCDETTITSIAPRNWYVQATSGNFTSAFVRLTESGLLQTRVIGTSSAQSGNYVSVGGSNIGTSITSAQTVSSLPAYFAIGNSLVLGLYSYLSGDWDVAANWTTDASGNTRVNSRVPGALDNVTILNGRTISISANTKQVNTLTMNSGGILDISSTSGHNFGTVTGQGKLMLRSNNFPGGTYTGFVASGGGTIEYYNLNNTGISATQLIYNHLIISNRSASTNSAYLPNGTNPTNYIINGNFSLKNDSTGSHTFSFGNSTASDNLINMTVYGDFTVDAGCNVRVNNFATSHAIPDPANNTTAYPVHTLSLYGNLTNNGSIRFTGLPSPVANVYYLLGVTASGGINYGDVQVFFYGATNNTVTCNGITDFYRLIVAKGTDKTYTLEVSSSNTNNFALYAPNDQGTNNFNGGPEGFGYGAYYKALFIHYGTLKLNENISIPSLTEGGQDFNVIPTAELWVNGANISTTVPVFPAAAPPPNTGYQAATLYGTLRISAGQFSTGDAAGMVLGTLGTPSVMIEGTGTLDASQVWTSTGGTNQISYIQTGGTSNFRLLGENHAGPMFGLSNINSTFTMNGGIINFTNNAFADATTGFQIMDIESQAGNYNVTGGTININLPSSATVYTANSTVPLYNVNISNRTGTGTTTVQWNTPGSSLSVLHDLTIGNLSVLNLNTSSINLSVGHDFTVSSGGTYTPSTTLTTTFNGSGAQAFNNAGTITGGLNNLTITNSSLTSIINNNVTVNGALTIDQNSVLNDSGKTVTVSGNIINSGAHISRVSTGAVILTGTAAQTLSGNGTGIFNNLTLNKTGGSVTAAANMAITGNLRLAGGTAGVWNILNIGSYNLALGANTMVYSDGTTGTTFNNNRMIQTSGMLSDGGVSKTYFSTTAFVFPFGFYNTANTTYYYMPQSIQFSSAPTAFGTVTTRPVNARHPLTQSSNSLACYWKTTSTGFTGVPAGSVVNIYYYDYAASNYFVSGTEANYIPAVYANSSWNTTPTGVTVATNQVTYNTNNADGEYTAGQIAAFGTIPTLYSVASGPWNNATTWSATRGGAAGAGIPTASNLVIICSPYTVTTPVADSSSSLTIESGSTLDLGNVIGHSFGSVPVCSGTLRIASTGYFPKGDWGNFLGSSGGTVEYYQTSAGTLTLPATYTLPGGSTSNITGYYNLITSPYNGSNVVLPNTNLTIYNNFVVGYSSGGGTSNCITQMNAGAGSTTLEVKGNITINQFGVLQYQNNLAEYVIADNDITIAAGGTLQVRNGGNSVANTLTVYGNLVNNGIIDLDSNYPTNDNYYCNLNFIGTLSKSLTSTSAPTRTRLYGITVNKGTSRDSILNVNVDPTGFQMGGGGLNLQNGTFRLTSSVTMPLSTGGFSIPSTACLSANGGTFNIATGAAAADLSLLGRLEILAGAVNIGPAIASASANAFNIVYASAGTPEIIISGGSLNVYSQIRRGTGTASGSLNYTQTGGTVTIGGKNSSTSRAVFEVLNGGSKFTMSNGSIILANHISAASPYDLCLDPDIENVTGGTIQFGLSGVTPASTLFYFQSSCSIGNLTLEATTNSSAIQEIYPLTLVGSLTIGGASSYYNTNGLDVTIGGNLTNNNTSAAVGLNVGGYQTQVLTQTTGFVGSTDQSVTGTASNLTNFADLDVSTAAGHSLSLSSSSNITVNGDLTLSSGTLTDNGNTITLLNNVDNNAAHYSSSASGGMIISGTIIQGITGNGSGVFGNIQINNSGHGVNMTDNSTINGQLKFTNGYLYIGNYALTFGEGASIVGADGTNHINLNGVSSDAGVTKRFPTGPSTFTFPIGDNGKYTPCTYNFTSNTNSSGATINVIPVNALHPTINPAGYTNYLNYYWKVAAAGFSPSTYNVTETYTFIPVDRTGIPANIERCDNSTSAWTTVSPGTISSPTFSFSCSTLLDGSFTIGDIFNSLPILYSTKSGNWNDATVWSPSYVPNGHSVVINAGHTVTLIVNGAIASSVDIEGVLDATNTVSHNIGQVSGTGKIRMSPTASAMFAFPGGSYDAFLANSTSTVEFYGNTDGTMPLDPGNINKPYQQVLFSGTGKKYISSIDTKVNGNLTISDGSKLDNTLYNKDLFVLGNWIDQNTSTAGFTAGTGTVHFSATAAQSITMSGNSMKEIFYNLEINNTAGLTINIGTVDVGNQLMLTLGNINFANVTNNILTITNTGTNAIVGGSVNSFVNGPLSKKILNGSSFQFPVGDANSSSRNRIGYVSVTNTATTGTQIWTAQFFDKNPTAGGYDITQMVSPLQSIVNNEYWNIIGPAGGSAKVVLSWDQYTGMSSSASTRALARVAEWVASWNSVGQVVTDNGQTSGTVATSTPVSLGNHFFSIGGANNIVPLLITSIASGDWNSVTTWNYQVPTSMDTVHISNNIAVTLNTNATVARLIVDNGGSFDMSNSFSVINDVFIGSGSYLKIESGASISTGIIILADGANYINLSSSAPILQLMRTISGTEGWRMLTAPNNVNVGSMFASPFVTQGFTGSSYPSLQPNLMWWDETSQGTSLQAWRQPSGNSDAVTLGKGYMYYVFNGALRPDVASNYSDVLPLTMATTGTENPLNPTAFDFSVTATVRSASSHDTTFVDTNAVDYGWNLVGNPTPSTINWNASSGWTKTNMDGTIYIWDPATSNYKTWNGSTGNLGSGKIAPFQAFWVKANATSPSLKCNNNVKSWGGTFLGKIVANSTDSAFAPVDSSRKKNAAITKSASIVKNTSGANDSSDTEPTAVLEMELSANGQNTQAYLMFSPGGKLTYDPFDAFSLVPLSENYLVLYSVAGPDQPAMQIQNLPDTGYTRPFVPPLYVGGTTSGQPLSDLFTLRWKFTGQLPAGWNIMLMDDANANATSILEPGELTFQYTTPADLISSGSSFLQKNSGVASSRQSLHALPCPVIQTVPNTKLAKSSTSASRFRLIITSNSDMKGYLPINPQLAQNYPNPFNPTTNITFSIPAQTRVTIQVFNILGQQVAMLTDREYPAGSHIVVWNATNVSSGIYFCRMTAAEKTQTKKMVVLR